MKGRTALVTGAARGIGAAIAEHFRQAGARVLAPTRRELELASDASIDAYAASLREPVDVIVNNAGINRLGTVAELADGDFEEVLKINLMGPLRLVRRLVGAMRQRRYGRILNISSIWGLVARERRLAYSASKSGLNGLTRALAVELAPDGILVNAIAPGYVDTELTRQNNSPEELRAIVRAIPLGRLAETDEIARLAAFLCSDANGYMTGQILVVDGGITCK